MSIFATLFGCTPKAAATTTAATSQPVAQNPAVVPVAAVAPASQQAAVTAQPPAGLGTQTAATLLLYDKNLLYKKNVGDPAGTLKLVNLYAPLAVGPGTYVAIDSWAQFITCLQQYQTIERLHLLFHGMPGELAINNPTDPNHPDQRALREIVGPNKSGSVSFNGVAPVVSQEIVLGNCETAANPKELVNFLDLFQTKQISGLNFFHVLWIETVKGLTGKESAADIRATINVDDLYLVPGQQGPSGLAGQAGTFTLVYEWFVWQDGNTGKPGLNPDHSVRSMFVPRVDATEFPFTKANAGSQIEDVPGNLFDGLAHVTVTP